LKGVAFYKIHFQDYDEISRLFFYSYCNPHLMPNPFPFVFSVSIQ